MRDRQHIDDRKTDWELDEKKGRHTNRHIIHRQTD